LGCGGVGRLVYMYRSRAHPTQHPNHLQAEDKPLTSPKTNLVIEPTQAILAPNVLVRGLVLEYKETKKREWEAAERQWRQAGGKEAL
jgi:hypothetical protein